MEDYQSRHTGEEIDDAVDRAEMFIPLSRDFSDDFNNDFAR